MGLTTVAIQLFEDGYGAFVIFAWFLYQIYGPRYLNQETILAPFFYDIPERVEDIDEKQDEITKEINHVQDHVEEVQTRQKVQMQVQRAQARATEQMDEDQVDEYLLQNGVEPNAFLHGDEMTGYRNWSDDSIEKDNESEKQDSHQEQSTAEGGMNA